MRLLRSALFVFGLAILATPALPQPSGAFHSISPMTRSLGALTTLTAHAAGTVNTSDQSGYNISRVVCVFNQSAHTGTPSTTFKIQNKDAASGAYYDLITSSAITGDATPTPLAAGNIASSANLSASMPIAALWRVSTIIAGTTPVVTGTVGCSVQ